MADIAPRLPDILAFLVVWVAVPLTWLVAVLLWRLSHADPEGAALRGVAVLTGCVALTVTIFALVFLNNGMENRVLDPWQTMVLTRGSLLVLSVIPALYWLRWYRRKNGHV